MLGFVFAVLVSGDGGEKDGFGCKPSTGEEWCPATEQCVRPFEAAKCPGGTMGCQHFCQEQPSASYGSLCKCKDGKVVSEGTVDVSTVAPTPAPTTPVTPAPADGRCYRPDMAPPVPTPRAPLPHTYTAADAYPRVFDWRDVDGTNYLTPLLNQHIPIYCGSCWLHGSISTLQDRLKIMRNAQWPDVILARQTVLNCGQEAGTCEGGSELGLYKYVQQQGLPDETCQQYEAVDHNCSAKRMCMNCDPAKDGGECYPVQRYTKYFVDEFGSMPNASVHQIKAEVFRRGPISCGIDASLIEKANYARGTIVSATARPDGKPWETDHVISIFGWGLDCSAGECQEYWHVRNSWGSFWGEQGMFRVLAGKNVMAIEQTCTWVVPAWPPRTDDYGPSDYTHDFPSAPEEGPGVGTGVDPDFVAPDAMAHYV